MGKAGKAGKAKPEPKLLKTDSQIWTDELYVIVGERLQKGLLHILEPGFTETVHTNYFKSILYRKNVHVKALYTHTPHRHMVALFNKNKFLYEKWSVEDAGKKLTKKDKQRLAQNRALELKIAVEQERIRLVEEERRKIEEERIQAIEKDARDIAEQNQRIEQLKESCTHIRKLQNQWLRNERKGFHLKEWQQYLKCDGLPDPSNCGEMNTYLHLWDKVKENTLEPLAVQKTNEVLTLLDTLDDFLDNPAVSDNKKRDWLIIRNNFREYQQYNLDCLAYRLLRDINNKLERLNIPTARQSVSHPSGIFTVVVWALVQLPIPMPNPKRAVRPPTVLDFQELGDMHVDFPASIDVWANCVRAMFVEYEHFSHRADCYGAPPVPDNLKINLAEVTAKEWVEKVKTKEAVRMKVTKERDKEAKRLVQIAQNTEKSEDIQAAQEAQKKQKDYIKVDASSMYIEVEDAQYVEFHTAMTVEVPENCINLRKYRILGGVFFLDLFEQPPQPIKMVLTEITLATLSIPKFLNAVPFHYEFNPPPPVEPGVVRKPEEIEEENKKIEAEYVQLLHVSLQLPSNVLWLDPPMVCQWDDDANAWSTKDVHDAKYNEEKQTIQFKLGRFGAFAMAAYKYNSMPYQGWELKPGPDNQVILTIMAAVLILEFTISGAQISLTQLQNAPSDALDHLLNKWYSLPRLRRLLRLGGVDVFPAPDAFLYLEGACEKQWPMEQHLYFQMAQCCLYFNFAWSRWNLLAGRRNVVMQMREASNQERSKQPNYQMLMVTPLKALLVDCTEVSQTFNPVGTKKMKFYCDFYHLILGTSSISMKCKLEKTPHDVINSVAQLLISTRCLSLS